MKNTTKLFIAAAFLSVGVASAQSGVGVGTTSPDASAALDVTSTTKGFLIPRLTTAQMNAIANPVEGLQVYNTSIHAMYYFNGTVWLALTVSGASETVSTTPVNSITSPSGKVWMDRNLGASRVAQSATDYLAYGQFYQWGRGNDGHGDMAWISSTTGIPANNLTNTLSPTDNPGHSLFIAAPNNWRDIQNDSLWQGLNGINNPCPTGYRLPTGTELQAEVAALGITNAATAFASPLKFTLAGIRGGSSGSLFYVGNFGGYWTSTTFGATAMYVSFDAGSALYNNSGRASALSVRCVQD